MKIVIKETNKNKTDKAYNKIFNIIDKHTFLFKVNSENEYTNEEGFVIEVNGLSNEMIMEIEKIKNVEIIL